VPAFSGTARLIVKNMLVRRIERGEADDDYMDMRFAARFTLPREMFDARSGF